MEPLRKALATIRKYLGGMTPSQKLLIAAVAVILIMTYLFVALASSSASMKELMPTASAEDQQRAIPLLQANGIKTESKNGKLMVPSSQQEQAWAIIAQSGQQPANSALVFDNIIKSQNWLNSKEQNRQIYQQMLNNFLSGVIGKFDGIKSATVFVDTSEAPGIGQPMRLPKASIALFTQPNKPLSQAAVDAAARMVAGAVSGLDVSRVSVQDGAGRPRKVTEDSELATTTYRDNAAALEKQFKDKIYNLVRHIDGVVVEVTATLDVTKTRSNIQKNLPVGAGTVSVPTKESSTSDTRSESANTAEPGVRSNVQANIATGSAQGPKNEKKTEDIDFKVSVGTENKTVDDPGGMPTRLVATVMVPRGYVIASILKEGESGTPPADGAKRPAPSADDIKKRFDEEEKSIKKALAPHVKTRVPDGQIVEGEVEVALVAGEFYASGSGSPGALAGAGGGIASILAMGGGMIDKIVLGCLALFAVGMMLMMLRRSAKRVEVPTAEELVGVPPQLQAKDDLVGEADESETAIAGIELGEEQLRADKIREQVADLVKSSPEVAARMVNRWIAVEQ